MLFVSLRSCISQFVSGARAPFFQPMAGDGTVSR